MTSAPHELHEFIPTSRYVCQAARCVRSPARRDGSLLCLWLCKTPGYLTQTCPGLIPRPLWWRRRGGASTSECRTTPNSLQIVSHDRPSRRAAGDLPEARTRERRSRAREDIRRAVFHIGIDWIGFERRSPCALGGLQSREDQVCHDALPAVVPAHEETRDRPDRQCVHTLEPTTCGQARVSHRAA